METSKNTRDKWFLFPHTNFKRLRTILFTVICSFALIMVACGDNSTGTNGGGGGGGGGGGNGGNGGSDPEPTFENVQDIFNNNCGGAGCHIGERTNGVRLDSYDNVMGSEGDCYGQLVVQEGDADGSPLVEKIESSNPTCGERMPEGGPYLSDEQIQLIRDWIDEGAQDN